MRYLFAFLVFFFALGYHLHADIYTILSKKVASLSKILKETNNLRVDGIGSSIHPGDNNEIDKIAMIEVDYTMLNNVRLEEARVNIIKLTEFYLEKINNDEKLQPFLFNPPFTYQDLRLGLAYEQSNGNFSPLIAYSFIRDGSVFYSKYDQKNKRLERVHEETFEEASRIVNGEKNISPENALPSP